MRDMPVNDEHYARILKELYESPDLKRDLRTAVKDEESDIEKGE